VDDARGDPEEGVDVDMLSASGIAEGGQGESQENRNTGICRDCASDWAIQCPARIARDLARTRAKIRICTTSAIAVLADNCGTFNILPELLNEDRTPDVNVQNGTLKAIQFLFMTIVGECAEYTDSVTPLLTHALIERDAIHREIACLVLKYFASGCFAAGKEDAIIHPLNHIIPNTFDLTVHLIDAVFDALDALRVALGPGVSL
jgi:hypothetical protein